MSAPREITEAPRRISDTSRRWAREVGLAKRREVTGPAARWTAAATCLVACLLATLPLVPAYGGTRVLVVTAVGTLLGAGVAAAAALRRWSAVVTVAGVLGVHLVAGTLLVAPLATTGGPAASLRVLLTGIVRSWKDALTVPAPLGSAPAVMVGPWTLALVASALVVSLAVRGSRRVAVGAALVPLLPLAASLVLTERTALLPAAVGIGVAVACAVAGALLLGTFRPERIVSLAVMGALVAGVGAGVPLVVGGPDRTVVRESVEPPFDPARQESPLATYRAFVKADETVLLEVWPDDAGAADAPVRLAVMDTYDGVVWSTSVSAGAGGTGGEGSGEFRPLGGEIDVTGTPVGAGVVVRGLTGVWLPTIGDTSRLEFSEAGVREKVRYNTATTTAVLPTRVQDGLRYRLEAALPAVPDDAALAGVPAADVELGEVSRVPEIVGVVAREWTATATSPIEVARALQQRLAEGGWYSDGLTERSPAGHGADRMGAFLEEDLMLGNGEQYASAMALMARELGLPARVVMGFRGAAPAAQGDGGDGGSADGAGAEGEAAGMLEVTGRDVDAWVEIAFDDVGWVPFFPTPDRSRTPDTSQIVSEPEEQPLVAQPRPTQPPPTEVPDARTQEVPSDQQEEPPVEEEESRTVLLVVAGGLLLLLLALTPAAVVLVRKALRQRRRRRDPDPRRRTIGAWDELLGRLADARAPLPQRSTRVETAASLVAAGAAGGATTALADHADVAQFGPGEDAATAQARAGAAWSAFDAATREARAGAGAWQRLRARLSRASLRRPRQRTRR